ncbi:TfuA-like protein [Streptomyces sp. BB1-1-1]|uniref:TfuA-like protein n=1 Tax=Streptomyces sp. BB1-1-1 TaxID=3074430 RepID=UPI0028776592|nr:TfuA-like protein [Streptomyces sp. BB1-1-1]WND33018.1 TfuA-like protein [Streptomyces sp. BB1-1-1]
MTTYVFTGSTLSAQEVLAALPAAVIHGPVRHGGLLALGAGADDTVVVIDGVFHHIAPVRHKEITDVLVRGARVIGASSMGALRAAELWPYGMEGVGLVFGMYAQGILEADDEVAVGHLPSGDRRQLTVPLVNVRWAISHAVAQAVLDEAHGADILEAARSLHYTERSWGAIVQTAGHRSPATGEAALALRRFAERHPAFSDLKRRDALLALAHCDTPRPVSTPSAAWTTPAWLVPSTMYLERWRGAFRPALPGGGQGAVSELDVLRFQQLYAPGFPGRYRRFALTRIAGPLLASEDRGLVHAALAAAAERGITAQQVPRAAWTYWLTPGELRDGGAERRLLKLLVRSFRTAPGAAPFHDVPLELRDTDAAWRSSAEAVSAADRLNEQLARTGDRHAPRHLPHSVTRRHLADVWHVEERAELEATARDRGFLSLDEAEETARRFVMLHRDRY